MCLTTSVYSMCITSYLVCTWNRAQSNFFASKLASPPYSCRFFLALPAAHLGLLSVVRTLESVHRAEPPTAHQHPSQDSCRTKRTSCGKSSHYQNIKKKKITSLSPFSGFWFAPGLGKVSYSFVVGTALHCNVTRWKELVTVYCSLFPELLS